MLLLSEDAYPFLQFRQKRVKECDKEDTHAIMTLENILRPSSVTAGPRVSSLYTAMTIATERAKARGPQEKTALCEQGRFLEN